MSETGSGSLPAQASVGTEIVRAKSVTAKSLRKGWPHDDGYRPGRFTGAILPLAFLLLTEACARLDIIPARLLPPPSELAQTLWSLAVRGELLPHIRASLARVLAGFAIGSLLAIALGLLVGISRRAEALLEPSFQALRAIPSLAWIPLLLLWLGIDETPKIVLIAIGAFFPVYLNLVAGIRDIDDKLIEVGTSSGLGASQLIRHILLPAALPYLFAGLRGGLSLAWMFLVAAELIATTRGVGYLLSDGRESSRPDLVLAAILILALLGKLSDGLLRRLEQHCLRWRDAHRASSAKS
ncbi:MULTISPECIES: ABC transporter permease [unclassified Herbaspirillum]|uniref:ABC transporter permease n=1 Tax=unclassified Herbaspirillum TaxID=2624150 RepID=UPI00115056F7|nr:MULTISPECIES: ABC transporter permease [unclassified Herbaspirillum]MBB5392387.1 sulfonate transport system permease protein [Herbaspirillum sp. SJZ102]TQK06028.1 sulfonate transport system permease protein [Herbaspirillum sp. SJZ130]TQK12494.1 sulfonate transport system permease protein [Herbaspirillum sp. SJZ106]